jgi:sensor histidine kinase regulating citrate/malate metabolism
MKTRKIAVSEYEALEKRYLALLADKMDLERKYAELEALYQRENRQNVEIRSIHENARRLKHDMRNHMMVIAACLGSEEYAQTKAYVTGIIDKLDLSYSYIETGNPVLNHIINSKLEFAQKNGMSIKAEIENLNFMTMNSVDFSAMLSNLLDNAIEAGLRSVKKSCRSQC